MWREELPVRRPPEAVYLSRIHHMTGEGSLTRAWEDQKLVLRAEDDLEKRVEARLPQLAKEDRAIHEEARALAQSRGWPADTRLNLPYGWSRMKGARMGDALAEILRILAREIFELESLAREIVSRDDEVSSLATRAALARQSLRAALVFMAPEASLPGAK
jgi:hypothetical protein